jgi:hypothetical protein
MKKARFENLNELYMYVEEEARKRIKKRLGNHSHSGENHAL